MYNAPKIKTVPDKKQQQQGETQPFKPSPLPTSIPRSPAFRFRSGKQERPAWRRGRSFSTNDLTSGTGAVYNGMGYSTNKSVNPGDVISGILMKEGFIKLPEIKPELADKTMIVNYGESGKRNMAGGLGGYAIEVTVNFISAETYEPVCSCIAEGRGRMEADNIRKAITRCLSALLSK
jgi:hypothetical protein